MLKFKRLSWNYHKQSFDHKLLVIYFIVFYQTKAVLSVSIAGDSSRNFFFSTSCSLENNQFSPLSAANSALRIFSDMVLNIGFV